ncbi:hypothetical protein [Burkholderia pseudomallei]|uniref:hypothetical protein n=1 Tax=Burkholderia pseudomallei TaxID=28450 RepID=UPI0005D98228|nr:hypothetical protein [Burkholderia pseudomallei]AJX79311.1 hypothetical protein BG16_2482 [Burkholderia pseudomallei MSHR2543]RAQ89476.1 hypothetical protein A4G85_21035 [Burkholderia pseudomallei]
MADLRCKIGDLAIVTKCDARTRIGMLVEIASARPTSDHDWRVRVLGGPVTGRSVFDGRSGEFTHAAVHDWNLTPIRGEADLDVRCTADVRQFLASVLEVEHV